MIRLTRRLWTAFEAARPTLARLVLFVAMNVGVTLFQLVLMPVLKALLGTTALVDVPFQTLQTGTSAGGTPFFVFDYAAGPLPDGGGGLAYFLAVQVTLAIAQVVNFFLQRNVTFKSNSDPWRAALWYAIAYVVITFGAAALQSVYKAPVYELLITTWGLGAPGEAIADAATMLINALLSCAVFFPIFTLIFRREEDGASEGTGASGSATASEGTAASEDTATSRSTTGSEGAAALEEDLVGA